MSSVDRVAHIWATHAIIVSNTRASSGKGNAARQTELVHLRMFAGFLF